MRRLLRCAQFVVLVVATMDCGAAGSRKVAGDGTPDPGLPVAEPVRDLKGAPPLVLEIAADEPLGHWRLGRGGPTESAMTLGGLDDAGGRAFTVEMWVEGAGGPLLSYSTEATPDALVIALSPALSITVMGQSLDAGVRPPASGWHHLAVSWASADGRAVVYLDGAVAFQGTVARGKTIGGPGVAVAGKRQRCWGGCLEGDLVGRMGDVGWHAGELGAGRMLSRVLVEDGVRQPTPSASSLPVEFRLGGGIGSIPESLAFSPDGRMAVSGGGASVRLWDVALGKLIYDLRGHRDEVMAVAYDPAGRYIASAAKESRILLWDTATGKLAHELGGHRHHVSDLAFSRDGRRLLSGSYDKSARIWDPATGRLIHELSVADRVKRVALSPDGRWAATSKGDDAVILWNVESGARVRELSGGRHAVALAFTPPSDRLVGGFEDSIKVWRTTDGKLLGDMERPEGERLNLSALFLDHGGKRLLGSTTKYARIWELDSGRLLHTLSGHDKAVRAAGFSPDDRSVASVSTDGTLRLWSVANGKELLALRHDAGVHSAAFSPDGRSVLSGGADRRIRLWSASDGKLLSDMQVRTSATNNVIVSRDERRLLLGNGSAVEQWDLASGRMEGTMLRHRMHITSMAFSPDDKRVMSRGGEVIVWEAASGRVLHRLHASGNGPAEWNGHHVAATDDRGGVVVWDAATGKELHTLRGDGEQIFDLALSPDGRRLVVGGGRIARSGEAIVWDLQSGERVHQLVSDKEAVRGVAFSPDGRQIVVVGTGRRAEIYDADSGARLHDLKGHEHWVYAAEFSRDGSLLVTASEDASARVWDARSGRAVAVLKGHQRAVRQAIFSPDGRRVLTASEDGAVMLWDARSGKRLRALRGDVPEYARVAFSSDGRFALGGSIDGVKLWATDSDHTLTLTSRDDDWLIYSQDGLFDSSPNGVRLVAMGQGARVFGADQLALTNNRPDRLLERFELGTTELHDHLKRRYLRRLEKAGLSEADVRGPIELPRARIVATERRGADGLAVTSALHDERGLKSYQIYVNDVPVFAGGKALKGSRARDTAVITLTPGHNKVEVSALSTRGYESLRALELVEQAGGEPGDLHFIGFGVSRYKNPKLNLMYAHKDAEDLAGVFRAVSGYRQTHVHTFVNDQVTVANLKRATGLLKKARPRDTLVLFIAGHGIHDRDRDATYYYVTHETDPRRLAATAASFEVIEKLLYDAAPRNKLLLLDTCESGEADDEYDVPAAARAKQRGIRARAVRALELVTEPAPAASAAPPRPWLKHRERLIYADLARRSGAIVFSSSRGGEYSYEDEKIQNGNFTEELLAALTQGAADADRDGRVNTDELRRYVSSAVARATDDLQHPTVDRDNIHQKFSFPILRR
jgi:WD40 repeat protein